MEKKLIDAAIDGNLGALRVLLREDPLLLNRVSYYNSTCGHKTPLHLAAMRGHAAFVRYVVNENPQLANELDSQQNSSPLHVASAAGHLDVVKALLFKASPDHMCFARDREGRNPLHIAAMHGRLDVLKVLMDMAPLTAWEKIISHQQQTVLHLCVKHNQLESLKILVPVLPELVNEQDDSGNSILHLAIRDKQFETVYYLLFNKSVRVDVNLANRNGMTPLDILLQIQKQDHDNNTTVVNRDGEIKKWLKRVRARSSGTVKKSCIRSILGCCFNLIRKSSRKYIQKKKKKKGKSGEMLMDNWLERKRSALMVVASLMATVTFQVSVNPPGGVWQDNQTINNRTIAAGTSIFFTTNEYGYSSFLVTNTIGFTASLSIILLLVSGLPFIKRRIFTWILVIMTWVALISTASCYMSYIEVLSPGLSKHSDAFDYAISVPWLALGSFLLLSHTIRLFVRMIKYLIKVVARIVRSCSSPIDSLQLV